MSRRLSILRAQILWENTLASAEEKQKKAAIHSFNLANHPGPDGRYVIALFDKKGNRTEAYSLDPVVLKEKKEDPPKGDWKTGLPPVSGYYEATDSPDDVPAHTVRVRHFLAGVEKGWTSRIGVREEAVPSWLQTTDALSLQKATRYEGRRVQWRRLLKADPVASLLSPEEIEAGWMGNALTDHGLIPDKARGNRIRVLFQNRAQAIWSGFQAVDFRRNRGSEGYDVIGFRIENK